MLQRTRGIAAAAMAVAMIVVLVGAGGAIYYSSTQKSTTTVTSVSTQTAPTVTSVSTQTTTATTTTTTPVTTTVTAPPVTSTATTTAPPVTVTSTYTSTSSATTTKTVTSTSKVTTTETSTATVTATVTGSTSSSYSNTTTTSTSTSCTSSSTTVSNSTIGLFLVQFAQTFSNATVTFGENTTTGPELVNDSYGLLYGVTSGSTTTYKMEFVESADGETFSGTAWLLSNGTALAVDTMGQNTTGGEAQLDLLVFGAPFLVVQIYDDLPINSLVPSSDIHEVAAANITLGKVTVNAITYAANSLPITYCADGTSYSFTTFVLQAGVIQGTNYTLLTYLDIQGTQTTGGTPQTYSVYIKVDYLMLG